ncbi:MAG: hypothetical protein ACXV8O_01535 [Methylobacter sp.]
MSTKLLKKSLEILEKIAIETGDIEIKAHCVDIMAELANKDKYEPDPIGYVNPDMLREYLSETGSASMACVKGLGLKSYTHPLYTSPPKRDPLTQAKIIDGWNDRISSLSDDGKDSSNVVDFICGARFAEKAHGIGEL